MSVKTVWPIVLVIAASLSPASAQEPPARLDAAALSPVATHFTIGEAGFEGDGVASLVAAVSGHPYILLGEYHRSPAISRFTDAFIRPYDTEPAPFLVLEIGPSSADALVEMASEAGGVEEALGSVQARYRGVSPSGQSIDPIPFFPHVSDAAFLETALQRGWPVVGIDQEFIWSGLFHVDRIWSRVPEADRGSIGPLYRAARDSLAAYYALESAGAYRGRPAPSGLATSYVGSPTIRLFLDAAVQAAPATAEVVADLDRSMQIYATRDRRRYWDSNALRVRELVTNFHRELSEAGFDAARDRALIKVGGLHAAKGVNGFDMHDVGNAVFERARAEGSASLHVSFERRYVTTDSSVVDTIEDFRYEGLRGFLDVARADAWTWIDLRPLRAAVLYGGRFEMTETERAYFTTYDVVVVPPVDTVPVQLVSSPPGNAGPSR